MVLDGVVGPAREELRDLGPAVAEGSVGLEDLQVLGGGPGRLRAEGGVSMLVGVVLVLCVGGACVLTLLISGLRWLCHLSLHCFPILPGR